MMLLYSFQSIIMPGSIPHSNKGDRHVIAMQHIRPGNGCWIYILLFPYLSLVHKLVPISVMVFPLLRLNANNSMRAPWIRNTPFIASSPVFLTLLGFIYTQDLLFQITHSCIYESIS